MCPSADTITNGSSFMHVPPPRTLARSGLGGRRHELRVVEEAQPGTIGLPTHHLSSGPCAVARRCRRERDVAADEGGKRLLVLEMRVVLQHGLPQSADRVAPDRLAAR